MFASRTESRQLYYTGKQVQHDGSHIGDAHNGCPNPGVRIAFATYWFLIIITITNYNYTSNRSHQNGPPGKRSQKLVGRVTRDVAGQDLPTAPLSSSLSS